MRLIFIVILAGVCSGLKAQCTRYEQSMKDGNAAMAKSIPDYDKAIISYQSAQIAAAECNLVTEEPAKQLRKVFEGLKSRLAQAIYDKKRAEEEEEKSKKLSDLAKAQAYANAAYIFSEKDPTIAVGFAMESMAIHKNTTAMMALLKAFNTNSWFYSDTWIGNRDMDMSADGTRLAAVDYYGGISVTDIAAKKTTTLNGTADNISFLGNGNLIGWKTGVAPETNGTIYLWNTKGEKLAEHKLNFLRPGITAEGRVLVPVLDDQRKVWLYTVNSSDGVITRTAAPKEIVNPDLKIRSGNGYTVIVQDLLYTAILITPAGQSHKISSPGYVVTDMDYSDGKFVFLLYAKDGNDPTSAIGFIDTGKGDSAMNIIPSALRPDKRRGRIRILDSTHFVTSSANGVSEITNIATNDVHLIPGSRPTDVIVPFQGEHLFLLARRAGGVSIYNYQGKLVAGLLSDETADGASEAFQKVIVAKDGGKILTITRSGPKLWHRPAVGLAIAVSPAMLLDSVPAAVTDYFKSYSKQYSWEKAIVDKRAMGNVFSDNLGQILMPFDIQQQSDVFRTGLLKEVDTVYLSKRVADLIFVIALEDRWQRLLILDPGIVFSIVKKEIASGRLSPIDRRLREKWVENKEFTEKIELLKLNPIK